MTTLYDLKYVREILKDVKVDGSHFYGVPIGEFDKEDLMKLCVFLGKWQQEESYEHSRQLKVLSELYQGNSGGSNNG